ncbi:MAG: alpha/beta hydrolase [Chloroflexi bacterium]|nr:alpha/beta hydrolase [Chloroflexota bacterium]
MTKLSSVKSVQSVFKTRRFWLTLAGAALAAGTIYYFVNREEINYNLRLLNAKRIGDKFYAEYQYIAKDVAYGSQPRQKLDVYQPDPASPDRTDLGYPVLVYVYGGSWNSGNKELYAPVAQRLLPEGVIVVVPDYRIYPEGKYREQTDDVAAALSWVLENIRDYGGDPARVALGGQSAGAHLTALALLDEQWLAKYGHSSAEVCGYYGISGVYDINAQMDFERSKGGTAPIMTAVMEGPANFTAASPATYVRPDLPPALLIHGDADETVPISMSENFQAKLESAGVQSEFVVYPGAGHSGLLFDALASNPALLVADLSKFARECPPAN